SDPFAAGLAVAQPGAPEEAVRVGRDERDVLSGEREVAAVAADPAGGTVVEDLRRGPVARDRRHRLRLPIEEVGVDVLVVRVAGNEVGRERAEVDEATLGA